MPAIEEYFGAADHEPTGSQSDQVCEDRIKVVFGAGLQDVELQAKSAGCGLRVSRQDLGIGIGRVDEQTKEFRGGQQLVQDL
jgi:hypothetical protein